MPNVDSIAIQKPRLTELVFSTLDIESRAATIKATYWLLLISVAGAVTGGYIGSGSEDLARFFTSTFGLIVGILLLNAVPAIAMAAVRRPAWGIAVLALDGFLSGIVISPLLFLARYTAPELIWVALGITAAIFASVTGYIMTTRKTFSAPRAVIIGAFVCITAAVLLNSRLEIGGIGIFISAAIGIFGVVVLVVNTSRVLLNPIAIGAVPGALMLFAGIFNVFVSVLNILLRILSLGRRR
jgi:FtsH-binding integral membrane protein